MYTTLQEDLDDLCVQWKELYRDCHVGPFDAFDSRSDYKLKVRAADYRVLIEQILPTLFCHQRQRSIQCFGCL